jgi:superfamily II RNA helicase
MELPEYIQLVSLLEKGVGIHHSGMIPILREIVEIMISKKYIQVLFATESFAIGLDCPIKTALFSSLTKFDGHYDRFLMGHEYTQMAGRAGRRGIDTIGNVVHLNNLFPMPMQSEYTVILKGKPQTLVSKFRISYQLLLSLLKNGKTTFSDFRKFVSNSMTQNEIVAAITNQQQTILQYKSQIEAYEGDISKCPGDILDQYFELQNVLKTLGLSSNKKRKCEDKINNLKKQNKDFTMVLDKLREKDVLNEQYNTEMINLENLENYLDEGIHKICNILQEQGFMEELPGDTHEYVLLKLGTIASNMAEVHPIIMTLSMTQNGMFKDFSVEQLIGLFACFTNVNVDRDCKRLFPHSEDEFLKQRVCEIDTWMKEFSDLENREGIHSGIDYIDALNFDMPDLSIQWAGCTDERQCKMFVQSIGHEKGVSVGDFTKAMLKISTVAREIGVIAETCGEIDLLHKLKQVDILILKYITTSQSLYV